MTAKSGYLELIIGPMFSGKTTRIMNIYDECQRNGDKVLVINYEKDTRYHTSMLSTHDRRVCPCIFVETLKETMKHIELESPDVILINEGQFFSDVYEAVIDMVETYKKKVYICGLDGDFKRQKFGRLLELIPLCDTIIKLKSKCDVCSEPALFSHRKIENEEQVVIGSDIYIPLCRRCYVEPSLSKEHEICNNI